MEFEISKIDAAKNQLEIAIRLFFNDDGNIVAVHTLTRASHEILEKLCSGKNIKSMHEEIMSNIKPDMVKEFRTIVDEPKNFFKHSGHDADKKLKFNPQSSEFFLWDACRLYQFLTGKMPKNFYLYNLWFTLSHPGLFSDKKVQEILEWIGKDFHIKSKTLFYREASSAYDLTSMAASSKN